MSIQNLYDAYVREVEASLEIRHNGEEAMKELS